MSEGDIAQEPDDGACGMKFRRPAARRRSIVTASCLLLALFAVCTKAYANHPSRELDHRVFPRRDVGAKRLDIQVLFAQAAACQPCSDDVRLGATEEVMSQETLVAAAIGTKDLRECHRAVLAIDDQPGLAKIAAESELKGCREAALYKLTDDVSRIRVALSSTWDDAASTAAFRVMDRSALPRIAAEALSVAARVVATDRLTDQGQLLELATRSTEWQVRRAAAGKLSGNAELLKIIANDEREEVKAAASSRLTYSRTLTEPVLWMRAEALHSSSGMADYLKSYPRGPHAAEARERLESPDVLEGELSLDYVAHPVAGTMEPASLTIKTKGGPYTVVVTERTRVPEDWKADGQMMFRFGRYKVRGTISDRTMTADVIVHIGQ